MASYAAVNGEQTRAGWRKVPKNAQHLLCNQALCLICKQPLGRYYCAGSVRVWRRAHRAPGRPRSLLQARALGPRRGQRAGVAAALCAPCAARGVLGGRVASGPRPRAAPGRRGRGCSSPGDPGRGLGELRAQRHAYTPQHTRMQDANRRMEAGCLGIRIVDVSMTGRGMAAHGHKVRSARGTNRRTAAGDTGLSPCTKCP